MNERDVQGLSGYYYDSADHSCAHSYLLPVVYSVLDELQLPESDRRVFDLGCGNGVVAHALTEKGFDVIGVDPSAEGISWARKTYPDLKLFRGSCTDDLASQYGCFPVVISLEVVEHVYSPKTFASCIHQLLAEDGVAVISTPYHGYWKNLALAVMGRLDSHFAALWEHGHIKFWSVRTLTRLLDEAGFKAVTFRRTGRIYAFAKSMVAIARK